MYCIIVYFLDYSRMIIESKIKSFFEINKWICETGQVNNNFGKRVGLYPLHFRHIVQENMLDYHIQAPIFFSTKQNQPTTKSWSLMKKKSSHLKYDMDRQWNHQDIYVFLYFRSTKTVTFCYKIAQPGNHLLDVNIIMRDTWHVHSNPRFTVASIMLSFHSLLACAITLFNPSSSSSSSIVLKQFLMMFPSSFLKTSLKEITNKDLFTECFWYF